MSRNHLTAFDRGRIDALHSDGVSNRRIARELNRDPSTIGRELRRNTLGTTYRAEQAQELYRERRRDCRPGRKLDHAPLRAQVKERIGDFGHTPEQVAGRLVLDYPGDPRMHISHEAIYQAIYGDHSLHYLIQMLPQARPKRRKKGQGKSRRGPLIPNRVGIEHRPAHIEKRAEYGHWEGDTVVGKNQDGFIMTQVERKSGLLVAVKTPTKHATEMAQAAIASLLDMPVSWVKSITYDNGSEFAHHETIAQVLGVKIYFAAPYASYQRGTNENTNGLIRRYLPKQTPFKEVSQRQLDIIVECINNTPRKRLAYRTPNEVFQLHQELLRVALRV
jgi:transposase, IS30 family